MLAVNDAPGALVFWIPAAHPIPARARPQFGVQVHDMRFIGVASFDNEA